MIQDILVQAEMLYQIAKKLRQEELEPHGLNHKKFRILSHIHKEGICNPSTLSDALCYDRPTTTILLKKLESTGWIKREVNHLNRRYVHVTLTDTGASKLEEILKRCETIAQFENTLNPGEMGQLASLLDRLLAAAQ